MTKQQHHVILALWTASLIIAIGLFWNRLFPGDSARPDSPNAVMLAPPQTEIGSSVQRIHQALKARNPGYNGRGEFVEQDGRITIAVLAKTGLTDLAPLQGLPLDALDVSGNAVSDLRPLSGLRLKRLGLEDTRVADLTPLKDMPLVELYMNNTPVRDLTPLRAMPLEVLNLYGTCVKDLSPLAGLPLKSLWLNHTPVKDISALGKCPLVSLTLEDTAVTDLLPLAGSKLQRLHIGQTAVTDLTPLQGLPLTRLIFTPKRITGGLDVIRNMSTLREIGPSLDRRMTPDQFWQPIRKEPQ